jgi:phage FluMu gp28-like protein
MPSTEALIDVTRSLFYNDGKTLYPYQEAFLKAQATSKKFIVNKSRQIGMSYINACWNLVSAVTKGETNLVVSPSIRQSMHFMDYVYRFLTLYRDLCTIKTVNETKTYISFDNGGAVYSLPNHPNTVRGFRAHHIIFDEMAHFLNGTDKAMMTAILPSISRGGSISIVSTPFGENNVFHDIWSKEQVYSDYKRFLINWTECPDIDKSEVERIKLVDPMTYSQEYNNQFLGEVDLAEFPFHLIEKCIDMELQYEELAHDKIYKIGVDIGRRHDLTAIAIFEELDGVNILRSVETYHDKKFDWQLGRLKDIIRNYTIKSLLIDSTGIGNNMAENLVDEFGAIVKPITFDNDIKQQMVLGLKELMHDGKLRFPNDARLINNIRSIQRQYSAAGYLKFDSGRSEEAGHADLFWALALALLVEKGGSMDFFVE